MITNSIAGELLMPSDRPRLWALAQTVLSEGGKPTGEIALSSGVSVFARCQAILAHGILVGALLQLSDPARARARSSSSNSLDSVVARWRSLTDAERAVAEVVALGLTNREAGRRVYLSSHTVDAHLRQIFRKLGINSRVELARIVGEYHHQLDSIDGRTTVLGSYRSLEDACPRSA
ncbi:MAG: response regulator transcription factor [Acidimicrobiales bacterium]|jgi:DNA-binding NarL/FixJ family response regulator